MLGITLGIIFNKRLNWAARKFSGPNWVSIHLFYNFHEQYIAHSVIEYAGCVLI